MKKIMLLGSGELGKEVIISAQRLGCHIIAVDRYENAPGMQVADQYEVINMLDEKALKENFAAIASAIVRAKPASAKGNYLKSITISTTMGPGIKLDTNDIANVIAL